MSVNDGNIYIFFEITHTHTHTLVGIEPETSRIREFLNMNSSLGCPQMDCFLYWDKCMANNINGLGM